MGQNIIKVVGQKAVLGVFFVKNGVGITGLFPTIEIRRMSDDFYLDFAAVSAPFFVSGGGTREKVIDPVSYFAGLYRYVFDPLTVEEFGKESFLVLYRHPLAPYKFLEWEVVSYEIDTEYIRKILDNDMILHPVSSTKYEQTIFDDGGAPLSGHDIVFDGTDETRTKTL